MISYHPIISSGIRPKQKKMNKRKIAIFVEGQAEYIFVRDFLCAWYEYDGNKLGLECYEFHSGNTNDVPYPFGSRESESFYQIYNVGNDRSVMSKMLKETARLKNAGFQLIVGLSDMFGDDYHQAVQNRTINEDINKRFKEARQEIIRCSGHQDSLRFHFAIMEVEAWFIGMYQFLQQVDATLTPELILKQLELDITADPEITHYHPAQVLEDIYKLAGKQYGKHESDICCITSALLKQDYQDLIGSGKCRSFKAFAEDIL